MPRVVPFLRADALTASGATHPAGPHFTEHVEVSERLVADQTPRSSTKVGEEMLALLVSEES